MKLRKALIIASLLAAGTLTGLTQASAQDDGSGRSGKELRKAQRAASERLDRFPRIAEFLKAHPGIAKKLREFKAKRGEAKAKNGTGDGVGKGEKLGRRGTRARGEKIDRGEMSAARGKRRGARMEQRGLRGARVEGLRGRGQGLRGQVQRNPKQRGQVQRGLKQRGLERRGQGRRMPDDRIQRLRGWAQEHPIKARMLKKGIENRRQGDARISRKDTNRAQRGREGRGNLRQGRFMRQGQVRGEGRQFRNRNGEGPEGAGRLEALRNAFRNRLDERGNAR